MIRKTLYLFTCLLILFTIAACKKTPVLDSQKVQVYTSMYPLEDFAKKIGKEYVSVTNLVPPGAEPHDFELSARERVKLSKADVLLYNGAGFEEWIEKTMKTLDQKKIAMVNTSENLNLSKRNGRVDPHVWLDPLMAKEQAKKIKETFVKVDAKHAKEYEQNYLALAKEFDQLDQEYKAMVKHASLKEFVVSHAAFHYLAQRYGLKQISVSGISPLEEPSPRELQRLIETMQSHHIKYIFFETLANNRVAKVIKEKVHADVLTLNPLEGLTKEELAQGEDYFSIMRENKRNLATALGAK